MEKMVEEMTWEEFRDNKLLWFVNRFIHVFGWAIVYEYNEDHNITSVYPARVKFRGFDNKIEEDGFIGISKYISENHEQLLDEAMME